MGAHCDTYLFDCDDHEVAIWIVAYQARTLQILYSMQLHLDNVKASLEKARENSAMRMDQDDDGMSPAKVPRVHGAAGSSGLNVNPGFGHGKRRTRRKR